MINRKNEALKAVHEASLSVACLLNDVSSMWARDKYDFTEQEELENKIENIQNKITKIETYLERFDH